MTTTVIVSFCAKPGRGAELAAWLSQNQAQLPSFAGFESISLECDPVDRDRVVEIEHWASADDHRQMLDAMAARGGFQPLADLLAEEPETRYLQTTAALSRPRGAAHGSRWEFPVTGGCACGAIRYACTSTPLIALTCYCRDCQRASGGASSTALAFPVENVQISGKEPKRHTTAAASGNEAWRAFCPDCGSPLFAGNSGNPSFIAIKIASLDDPNLCAPVGQIWTKSAPFWAALDYTLPSFPENPR